MKIFEYSGREYRINSNSLQYILLFKTHILEYTIIGQYTPGLDDFLDCDYLWKEKIPYFSYTNIIVKDWGKILALSSISMFFLYFLYLYKKKH